MGTQVLDFQHPGVEGGGIRNAEMLVSSSRLMRPPSTHRSPKKNNNEMKKKRKRNITCLLLVSVVCKLICNKRICLDYRTFVSALLLAASACLLTVTLGERKLIYIFLLNFTQFGPVFC